MTSSEQELLDRVLDKLEECFRATSVADSLEDDWRKQLTAPLRNGGDGVRVGAVVVHYGKECGWLTLLRDQSGKYQPGFWTPELRISDNAARKTIEAIRAGLSAVIAPEEMQTRGAKPYEWLIHKGWTPKDLGRIRC